LKEIGGAPFMVLGAFSCSPILRCRISTDKLSGADVGHPGAGVKNQPSIASLVWSHDINAVQYVAFSRVQRPRTEIIEDLQAMMKVRTF
jgi:eukaryotic translation initiation factor 2C